MRVLGITRILSDEFFVRLQYRCWHGGNLNLDNPQDYNEKIQWQKLNYRNEMMRVCADKFLVRDFVSERIGEQYLVPLLAVFEKVEDLDLEKLPSSFVLKATRASSWNIVCVDKKKLEMDKLRKRIRKWFCKDFFEYGREWQYKGGVRRVICEDYIPGIADGKGLMEYKFYTFRGITKYIWVDFSKEDEAGIVTNFRNIYDAAWNFQQDKSVTLPNNPMEIQNKPVRLEDMKNMAYKLAREFPQCRVDFYASQDGRVFFGEMTFTSQGGCGIFRPDSFGKELGGYVDFQEKKAERYESN